jgi:hypothetical protein
MGIENPSSFSPAGKDNSEKKKKTGLTKTLITAGLVTLGGVIAAGAETPKSDNEGKGSPETTQTPTTGKSHERSTEIKTISYSQPSPKEEGDFNMDDLLKAESSKSVHTIKVKGPDTEGLLPDKDIQNQGKRFETPQGTNAEVEKKYKSWKKDNPQSRVTQISFNKFNRK